MGNETIAKKYKRQLTPTECRKLDLKIKARDVTKSEIAIHIGHSTNTVSRYMNGHRVKESTAQAIQEAINELDNR